MRIYKTRGNKGARVAYKILFCYYRNPKETLLLFMTLPSKLAFVDIETTGGSVNYDRIIEIGIVRVEDGQITQAYKTLINPSRYLPPEITNLTGIKPEELEDAPSFWDVHQDILEAIGDCIFVAHNVRFDFGFLKSEFKRLNKSFSPKHFCTVKLSRSLFPQFRHHNLDSLIERFSLKCANRHRAYDDAFLLWEFYQIVLKQFSREVIIAALSSALKKPSLPINLSSDILDNLPESPGIYIFYDAKGSPLYVGKSINIKERVLSHFSSDYLSSTEMKIAQQIQSIETVVTTGELGALIKEAQLIKKLQPLYNRRLRTLHKLTVIKRIESTDTYKRVTIETLNSLDLETIPFIVGIFRSQKRAKEFLIRQAKRYQLCEKLLGVEKTNGSCFGYRLGLCKGACIEKESPTIYNLRHSMAFAASEFQPWPFPGPILIEEKSELREQKELFLVDKWCFLGSLASGDAPLEPVFDLDTYKILHSFMKVSGNLKKIHLVENQDINLLIPS